MQRWYKICMLQTYLFLNMYFEYNFSPPSRPVVTKIHRKPALVAMGQRCIQVYVMNFLYTVYGY